MTATLAILGWVPPIVGHPFMRNAFLAGTGIAAGCGAVGYFVVLRSQVFTGDALSHVAFTGALAALAAGVDLRFGLFGATIAVAVGMGVLGRSGRADDVVIGSVFAWMLGLGVLFLSIYTSTSSGANGTAGVSVLFGSILGLSAGAAAAAALIGVMILIGVFLIARPLLFVSLDEAVAAARGVPVRALGIESTLGPWARPQAITSTWGEKPSSAEMRCSTRDGINNAIDPAERAAFLSRKAELFTRIAQDAERTGVDDYSRQVRQMATDARTAAEQAQLQLPQQQVGPDQRRTSAQPLTSPGARSEENSGATSG